MKYLTAALLVLPSLALAQTCLTPQQLSHSCWHGKNKNCPPGLQQQNVAWAGAIKKDASLIEFQGAQWLKGKISCNYGVNIGGTRITVYRGKQHKAHTIVLPKNTYTEIGYAYANTVKQPKSGAWGKQQWQCTSNPKACSMIESDGTHFACSSKANYHGVTVKFGQSLKNNNEVDCLYYPGKLSSKNTNPFNPTPLVFQTIHMPNAKFKNAKAWRHIPLSECKGKNLKTTACSF